MTVLAVGAGFVMATGASAAAPAVTFAETSSWDGGYVGQYTIANSTSSAMSTWKVGFALPAGSTVTSLWNGTEASSSNGASGPSYTVTPAGWNANIPAGGSVSFGFEVSGTGQPSGCTINGAACVGGSTPSSGKASTPASPSAGPSIPASPTPSKPASPSPSASQSSAPPPPSGAFGKFAPYADLSLYPLYNLSASASVEGTKFFNLAFITTNGACNPEWGGVTALNDASISADISALRAAGGDVRVSFGGASGTELAQSCTSASSLAAAYQKVISAYSLKYIDFDVEGAAVADTASINLRNQAIATLEANNPGLKVSYTLPVLPSGLTGQGVSVLSSAKAAGVSLDAVNVMAMDYGASFTGDMATLAEQAASATAGQVQSVWTSLSASQALAKVAVTPMIGVNDVSSETFSVADASALASWAKSKNLAWLSFWSATRDKQCAGGAAAFASATCSSVVQSAGAFGQAMSAY
ncbi:cellulose binding domain-containing protein [Actinocrinis sp.]|uniref:cellulose binding domain-containing protein n=1 Tax=Actinocrinis sp. TaxID=1920516 RepID=UPI002D73DCC1|nr:cellulose binding domain-containing protein [Actinocrinis sp.]HZP54951.1 cellulose binding domain-containing protein [Actinocrinis sp.]